MFCFFLEFPGSRQAEIYSQTPYYPSAEHEHLFCIEAAAKQFKARFTGPGMRWSRTGISRLIPIRAAVLSHTFDDLCPSIYAFSKS